MPKKLFFLLLIGISISCTNDAKDLDLSKATILISPIIASPVHETAGTILIEEIEKRTSLKPGLIEDWGEKTIIALALTQEKELYGEKVPNRIGDNLSESNKEGYRIFMKTKMGKISYGLPVLMQEVFSLALANYYGLPKWTAFTYQFPTL